jgi:hypothetical protein
MSSSSPTPPVIPETYVPPELVADLGPIFGSLVSAYATKATAMLGVAIASLGGAGVIDPGSAAQLSSSVIGGVLVVASIIWTYYRTKTQAQQRVAAAATGNPAADPAEMSSKVAVAQAINDPASPIKAAK